jgi:hypothetical protein
MVGIGDTCGIDIGYNDDDDDGNDEGGFAMTVAVSTAETVGTGWELGEGRS